MESINPINAVKKLSEILKIASIDIECVGCKEVYPDFMTQLISRISSSVTNHYHHKSPVKEFQLLGSENGYREKNGQIIGVSWNKLHKMDMISAGKSRRGRPNFSDPVHAFRIVSERKEPRGPRTHVKTPHTERFQYKLAKTNEIDLAIEKKSQRKSERKDIYRTPHGQIGKNVRFNELSSGGKYVFGRSGSKWDRGENFEDVVELDFYEKSKGRLGDSLSVSWAHGAAKPRYTRSTWAIHTRRRPHFPAVRFQESRP